jgi:hypothetical protein
MFHPLTILKSVGLGAGMMYFLDPISGNRRRSLIRDQMVHACSVSNKKAGVVYRDASNRLQGAKAELRSVMEPSDHGLVERVQESALEVGRTLGMQGNTWSPTAKGAVLLAGAGILASIMNKRDLAALACGAAGLAFMAKELADQDTARRVGRQSTGGNASEKQSSSKNKSAKSEASVSTDKEDGVPTDKMVTHNL